MLRGPALKPGLHRAWRAPRTLQVGLDPRRALVLDGLDAGLRSVLDVLDGSHTEAELLARAGAHGTSPSAVLELLRLLSRAGLLLEPVELSVPAPAGVAADLAARSLLGADPDDVLASRGAARVDVVGAGRVGGAIATLLVAAAVGSVVVVDDDAARPADAFPGGLLAEDEGFPRARTLAARLGAARSGGEVDSAPALAPAAPTAPGRPAVRATRLVVLGPDRAVDPAVVAGLVRDGVPHLHVELRETLAVVGPLVVPGRSSCQRCHDLHRCDRDPQWPLVRAQLHDSAARAGCDVVLAAGVAAVVAAQVLGHLEGRSVPAVDGTLEVALPDLTIRRRSWRPHPTCGCTWQLTG